jgi:type VI protein secretion system component VasK
MTPASSNIEEKSALFAHAEANPPLAHALGLTRAPTAERKTPVTSEADTATARTLLQDLESRSLDEVRTTLADEAFSLSALRMMAELTGMSGAERLNREALVHHLMTHIAQVRGEPRAGEP